MEYRPGVCSDCGARFKVPASFSGDKAKCKSCGGLVEIGPVQAPATAKDGGTAGARAVPAKKVQSSPAKPRPKTVSKTAPRPAAKADAPSGKGTPRSRPSKATRRRREGEGEEETTSSRRRTDRRGRHAKGNKNWGLMLGGLIGLAILTAAAIYYYMEDARKREEAANKPPDVAALEGQEDPAAEEGTPEPEPDPEPEPEPDPEPDPDPAEEKPEETPEKKQGDPSMVDLTLIADFERYPGTTDDEWIQYGQWMEVLVDPWSPGRKRTPAREGLVEAGRKAFPTILNYYKTIDVTTDEGNKTGDLIQRDLLKKICSDRANFGWKYSQEPGDQFFNKKVIERWCNSWDQVKDSDLGWSNLSKIPLEKILADKGEEPAETGGGEAIDDF